MSQVESDAEDRAEVAAGYPRQYWYAALPAQRLADTPVRAQVLDWTLALFRDAEGKVCAVHDRCVHRGAALHLGEVKDGALACRYHGWRYGGDGACVHIPSLAEGQSIAKGVGVRGFPCAEADGYVWVWMGQGAPDAPQPAITDFGRFNWLQGSLTLNCHALAAIENNLDWCHPVFAHPHTHGMYFMNQAMGFRDHTVEMRRTADGVVVFQPATASADDPVPPNAFTSLTYALPDRVTVAFNGPQGAAQIILHMVPTGPASCRQEWLLSMGPADPATGPTVTWSDAPQAILEQDRALMETAQAYADAEGRAFERSVEADAPTLLARRIYALACAGRWREDAERLPSRRVLTVRT